MRVIVKVANCHISTDLSKEGSWELHERSKLTHFEGKNFASAFSFYENDFSIQCVDKSQMRETSEIVDEKAEINLLQLGLDAGKTVSAGFLEGSIFAEFKLLEEIGRGGMGVVFKALQTTPKREVALKILLSGQFASIDQIKRFQREVEAAGCLDHPNIVPVFDAGVHDDQAYLVMRYVKGDSLAIKMKKMEQKSFSSRLDQYTSWISTIAKAIHHAHQRRIVHRDIKPENILIDEDSRPFITDFGIAKDLTEREDLTQCHTVLGTPSFLPPEQVDPSKGSVTTLSDVYSLGVILYQALTSRLPFDGGSESIYTKILQNNPIKPSSIQPGIDRDLETIIMKCLEKSPDDRYGSAEALAEDLDHWKIGEPIEARSIHSLERLWKFAKRKPVPSTLAALVSVLLLVIFVGSITFGSKLKRVNRELLSQKHEAEKKGTQVSQALSENRQLLIESNERAILHFFEKGNMIKAYPLMIRALELEQGDPHREWVHRMRIGSALRAAPRLVYDQKLDDSFTKAWKVDEEIYIMDEKSRRLLRCSLNSVENVSLWGEAEKWRDLDIAESGVCIALLPEGRGVSFGDIDAKKAKAWKTMPIDNVKHLSLSPDGLFSAITHQNTGTITLVNLANAKSSMFETDMAAIEQIAWSPNSDYFAAIDFKHNVQIHSTSGKLIDHFSFETSAMSDALSGKENTTTDEGVLLPIKDGNKTINRFHIFVEKRRPVKNFCFSSDGKRLLIQNRNGFQIRSNQKNIVTKNDVSFVDRTTAIFSPNGEYVLIGNSTGSIQLIDAGSGRFTREFKWHNAAITALSFDPTGSYVVSSDITGHTVAWEWRQGKVLCSPALAGRAVSHLYSSNNAICAILTRNRFQVWQMAHTMAPCSVPTPIYGRDEYAFSDSNTEFYIRGKNTRCVIGNYVTMKVLPQEKRDLDSLHWEKIKTGQQEAKHPLEGWTLRANGHLVERKDKPNQLLTHDSKVSYVGFSPNGNIVVTSTAKGETRLWDAKTLTPLSTPLPSLHGARSIHWRKDYSVIGVVDFGPWTPLWNIAPCDDSIVELKELNRLFSGNGGPFQSPLSHHQSRAWRENMFLYWGVEVN